MKKISQAELKKMQAGGATVSRKMGTAKPAKPAPQTKPTAKPKEKGMASMGASMKHMEAQAQATMKVIAHNTAVIEDFRKDLKDVVEKVQTKVPYVFDVERTKDKLIDRIIATPQLK